MCNDEIDKIKVFEAEDGSCIISYKLKEQGYFYCPICEKKVEILKYKNNSEQVFCSDCDSEIIWKNYD